MHREGFWISGGYLSFGAAHVFHPGSVLLSPNKALCLSPGLPCRTITLDVINVLRDRERVPNIPTNVGMLELTPMRRINRQFRVCFRWTRAGAEDVEIVDYH